MLKLIDSLDRVLSFHPLQAFIPERPYNGHRILWDDDENSEMNCHRDIEERFHWSYGPFLRPDYPLQIESMLNQITVNANKGDGRSGWIMCSTVRMKIICMPLGEISELWIEAIFIRPCLQRNRILGKILRYFAEHLNSSVKFSIRNCFPESQTAMDTHYGGKNNKIFLRIENFERGSGKLLSVTYTLMGNTAQETSISKSSFLELTSSLSDVYYPNHNDLNGKLWQEIPQNEQSWAEIAVIDSEHNIHSELISMCFRFGFDTPQHTRTALEETLQKLNKITEITPNKNLERMSMLLSSFNFDSFTDDSYVYVTNEDILPRYRASIQNIEHNIFFISLKLHVKTRVKNKLLTNYRRIKSMQTILADRKIPAHTQHTVFTFKSYAELLRHEKTFIRNHIGNFPALMYILEINDFSAFIKIQAVRKTSSAGQVQTPDDGEIQFSFDSTLHTVIQEFLSKAPEILHCLDPLIKNQ